MLIEVSPADYCKRFPINPHPFVSEAFIELNKRKVEKIVRLVDDEKPAIGLVAGIHDGKLKSPFSAPFGGFHFRNELTYISEIDHFVNSLKFYAKSNGLKGIELILPPDLYHPTFNSKAANSLFRNGYQFYIPDITAWVDLHNFNGSFSQKNSRECYRQAVRNGLRFELAEEEGDKLKVYELICNNRARFGRPIFMRLFEILETGKLWPIDFFKVVHEKGDIVASAIMYRYLPEICYAVFWGDSDNGRPLKAMDFLVYNLLNTYKDLGYVFLDMGISTESGVPNEGLLRFKESHESVSSLRFRFYWDSPGVKSVK